MEKLFYLVVLLFSLKSSAQSKSIEVKDQILETSCGQCNFKMAGSGCTLAVKIENIPYFAKGVDIDDYGDAHASDGFCLKIRKAKVSGFLQNEQFVVKSFELLPEEIDDKEIPKK